MIMNCRLCDIDFDKMVFEKKKCIIYTKNNNSVIKRYKNIYSLEALANNNKYKNLYIEVSRNKYNSMFYYLYQEIIDKNICIKLYSINEYGTLSEMLEECDKSEKISKETFLKRLSNNESKKLDISLLDIELCRIFDEALLAEHYSEYRLEFLKAQQERWQKQHAEWEARKKAKEEQLKAEVEKNVQIAIQTLKDKKELKNFDIEGTTIILYLMKKFNINVPLKTQGWINNALIKIYWTGDKPSYSYYSSSKNSTVFNRYLNELINVI
nr:MAG TPA: hypothetical protein [Caudoviricetes sp.]